MPNHQEQNPQLWRCQRATVEMIQDADLDKLFDGVVSVHADDLEDTVRGRLRTIPEEATERPLFEMLAAILGMGETGTKTPPFGSHVGLGGWISICRSGRFRWALGGGDRRSFRAHIPSGRPSTVGAFGVVP